MNAQQLVKVDPTREPTNRMEPTSPRYPSRDEGPWPEPSYIDPAINGVIGSIQSHMRKGVPIS